MIQLLTDPVFLPTIVNGSVLGPVHVRNSSIVNGYGYFGHVGSDTESWRGVIGRQGEETLNRNGHRLLGLCATNNLVILNTFFQYKEIHKFTWESRGRGLRSIIDYFILGKGV